MRVLVTGDGGYIGAVLVPMFVDAGHEVVGLDAGWYDGCDFGAQPDGLRAAHRRYPRRRTADLEGFDAVVHLAAISNDPIGHLNPDATYASTLPARCIWPGRQAGRRASIRLLLVLFALRRCGWRAGDERRRAQPRDARTAEQGDGRSGNRGVADETSARATCATPPRTDPRRGSGRHRREQPHRDGVDAGRGRLQSDGSPWRPLVHVEDISRALLAALEAPRDLDPRPGLQRRPGRGRGTDPRRRRAVADHRRPCTFAEAPVPTSATTGSTSARSSRPYRPSAAVDGHRGIERAGPTTWANGATAEDFEGPRFVRLERIHELIHAGQIDDDAAQRGPRPGVVTGVACAGSAAPSSPHLRRPGHVPAVRALPHRRRARPRRDFYPLHVRVCDECLLVQLPAYIAAEDIFSDYAYFSSSRDSWVAHARAFVDQAVADWAGSRVVRRRGGQQRRLPASARGRPRYPITRHRASRQHRRGRSRRGMPTEVPSSARRLGREVAARTWAGRPRGCQQRLRPRPRHRRLRQGLAGAGGRHRLCQHRDPAPAPADRGQRVRHHLPRALLLSLAADRRSGCSRPPV